MKKNRRMIKGLAVTIAVVFGITTIDASTGIAKTYADAATEAGYDITTDNGKKTDYVVVTTDDAAYHYLKKMKCTIRQIIRSWKTIRSWYWN